MEVTESTAPIETPDGGTVVRLFRTHARRLGRVLARRLRNPDDVADASQEVFLKLWRREQAGHLREEAVAYMHSAAITVAIDHERRRTSRGEEHAVQLELEELAHSTAASDDALHWREGVLALVASLKELPGLTQQAFILYHFDGLSHVEIAARLTVSVRSIERHMARALSHCKDGLRDYL